MTVVSDGLSRQVLLRMKVLMNVPIQQALLHRPGQLEIRVLSVLFFQELCDYLECSSMSPRYQRQLFHKRWWLKISSIQLASDFCSAVPMINGDRPIAQWYLSRAYWCHRLLFWWLPCRIHYRNGHRSVSGTNKSMVHQAHMEIQRWTAFVQINIRDEFVHDWHLCKDHHHQ